MQFRRKPIIVTAHPVNGEDEIYHTGDWILTKECGSQEIISTEKLNKDYFKYFHTEANFTEYLETKYKLREFISVYDYNKFEDIVKNLPTDKLFKARSHTVERIKDLEVAGDPIIREYKRVADELAHYGCYKLHEHEESLMNSGLSLLQEARGIFRNLINIINAEIVERQIQK